MIQVRQVKQRDIDYEDLTLVDHLVRDVAQRPGRARRGADRAGPDRVLGPQPAALGGHPRLGRDVRRRRPDARRQRLGGRDRVRRGGLHRPAAAGDEPAPAAVLLPAGRRRRASPRCWPRWPRRRPLDLDPSLVVTANIIMLLAGVGFMGALQDALSGFYVTAGARLTEALLATAGIIAGVSGGLTFADVLGVDIGRLDPGGGDSLKSVTVMALGARSAPAAFAFASYAPRRIIAPDRADRRRRDGDLAVVDDPRLRPHLADGDRGVLRRPGQLHRRRPAAGAAAGGRRVGGRADAARPLDLPRAVACSPRAARYVSRACWR